MQLTYEQSEQWMKTLMFLAPEFQKMYFKLFSNMEWSDDYILDDKYINDMIDGDDLVFAHSLYRANISDEYKIYLKMKWSF